ncbi:MAG: hypothetical protein QNJ53_07890 [Pleurocapsa sp. MO_192.B19]|nr:hypothetical protein [Pleurocapsa sp. MO_192.B19]
MKTFLNTQALLSRTVSSEEIAKKIAKNSNELSHIVGVFSHHRDAKVALDDLQDAGFPSNWITLIARNCRRYSWSSNLNIYNCFEQETFGLNQITQGFFQRLFQRGKYLVLVTGNKNDVNSAASIIGRRRSHSEVWRYE